MEKRISECGIVKDLLPLYAEGLACEDSVRFVESHIESCEDCRREVRAMKQNSIPTDAIPRETVPLDKMRRMMRKKRTLTVIAVVLILCAAFMAVFVRMTEPIYLPYSDETVSVTERSDGSVLISFGKDASDFAVYECAAPDGGTYYSAEAWYTVFDRLWDTHENGGVLDIYIAPDNFTAPTVYYVQNNGDDDVFLCGEELTNGGIRTLPRLVLGYYLLTAAGASVLTAVMYILLRKRERVSEIIGRIGLLPLSYIAAHFLIKGVNTVSYSAGRDFCLILIAAAVIYSAAMIVLCLLKEKYKQR